MKTWKSRVLSLNLAKYLAALAVTGAVAAGSLLGGAMPAAAQDPDAPSVESPDPTVAPYRASCPAAGRISQGYHSRHDGIDIANRRGTPIYATGPGTVTASGPAQGYGQWIRIRHVDGSMTEYGHMYRRYVRVGDRVRGGQRIALMGSEGNATGPHLHLRTYRRAGDRRGIDPIVYLRARGLSMPCRPGGLQAESSDTPIVESDRPVDEPTDVSGEAALPE